VRRLVLALALTSLAGGAAAQRPVVSPSLSRVLNRDTTVRVWLFVTRTVRLEDARAAAQAAGARIRRTSRWLRAISAEVSTATLRALAAQPVWRRIQPVARFVGRPEQVEAPGVPGAPPRGEPTLAGQANVDSIYGPSFMPFRRLNARILDSLGYRGAGVRIALFDAGFNPGNPAFAGVLIAAQYDFVTNQDTVAHHPHGTATWGLLAGQVTGQMIGLARDARFLLARTEDAATETRVEEDNYVAALEWADSVGVDIVSSSIGYLRFDSGFSYEFAELDGDVAVTTVAADSAAARGITVVTAMGNDGPRSRTLITPADGDSVISVGAEDSLGVLAGFSSRGPTADDRIKPDFVAPGARVWTITGIDQYGRADGTSFATPLTAGVVALVKQLHPTYGPIDLRNALRGAASNRARPDTLRGWGRPDATSAAFFPRGVRPLAPGFPLTSVTPTFDWTVDDVPAIAGTVSHRLRVARDSAFNQIVIDTTTDPPFTLPRALPAGSRVFWSVTATGSTGGVGFTPVQAGLTVPQWVRLLTFDDPVGVATNDTQPEFAWAPADVASPPGPFTYDLTVRRASTGEIIFRINGLSTTTFRVPAPLDKNTPLRWSLVAHAGPDSFVAQSRGVFLVLDQSAPVTTLLFQNFPNPFPQPGSTIGGTCFWFDVATPGPVRLEILDLSGRLVRVLFDDPALPAGRYGRQEGTGGSCDPRLSWNGVADNGAPVPAGVYLYKLKAPGTQVVRRLVYRGSPR
jgi:subtilisin family serine protease